jgi:hypothetical protein
MNALALAIAALVAVTPARAEQLAGHFAAASQAEHVGAHWLVALAYHESSFDTHARSHVGARGLMQLHPRWWPTPADEAQHVLVAARVLRLYRARCGTMVRAYGAYRSGACKAGPKALATWRLARLVRARLERPSANRLRAPVLR